MIAFLAFRLSLRSGLQYVSSIHCIASDTILFILTDNLRRKEYKHVLSIYCLEMTCGDPYLLLVEHGRATF